LFCLLFVIKINFFRVESTTEEVSEPSDVAPADGSTLPENSADASAVCSADPSTDFSFVQSANSQIVETDRQQDSTVDPTDGVRRRQIGSLPID
jgi:hypothetical protein